MSEQDKNTNNEQRNINVNLASAEIIDHIFIVGAGYDLTEKELFKSVIMSLSAMVMTSSPKGCEQANVDTLSYQLSHEVGNMIKMRDEWGIDLNDILKDVFK
ncbi:MAG: hypothetical protein ACOCQD_00205 [archaeon]